MTDITIKYDHGQMLIHLDNFLSDRKISEVRKLIKLIRQSYTPECEEQIKEYIQCGVKELDNIIMITEKRIDRNEAEVKDAEKDLKTWLYFRSLHKKGSDGYRMMKLQRLIRYNTILILLYRMMKVVERVNKAQKEVQQAQLNDEKKVIKLLELVYEQAKKDCEQKIRELSARTDLENLQSIVYQKEYQQMMVDQLEAMLYDLHEGQFKTIADYLEQSYINGYVGMFYDLQSTGIPLVIPIQQDQVVKALKTNSKLSSGLYKRLGEDVDYLKRSIRAELSRGISSGSSWNEMAVRIANGMNSPFRKAYNNAIRIARTEGHRIQNEGALDGQHGAKKKGADIVKQWDSTLDGRTRDEHRECDGQIREIDEPFDVGGEKMQAPGVGGSAKNVCNCRCCLLQRAKWALDEDELEELKERAAFLGLDKSKDFENFKQKYCQLPENADTMEVPKGHSEAYESLMEGLKVNKVTYREVKDLGKSLTSDEIIDRLAGGDRTKGSCSSLGFAYIGNKAGFDVLDFRGGSSQSFFSMNSNIKKMLDLPNVKGEILKVKKEASDTAKIIRDLELDKEYYMSVGKHASIIRNTADGLQYLELQSAIKNGWMPFDRYGSIVTTLQKRFGCRKTVDRFAGKVWEKEVVLMEVDSFKANSEFKELLGYINTATNKQKKGVMGSVK